jgi:hypothetical protein
VIINELEMMWNELVLAYFGAPSLNLPGGTEEIHDKPQSGYPVSRSRFEPITSQIQDKRLNAWADLRGALLLFRGNQIWNALAQFRKLRHTKLHGNLFGSSRIVYVRTDRQAERHSMQVFFAKLSEIDDKWVTWVSRSSVVMDRSDE